MALNKRIAAILKMVNKTQDNTFVQKITLYPFFPLREPTIEKC